MNTLTLWRFLDLGDLWLKRRDVNLFNFVVDPNLNLCIHPDFWPTIDHWSQAISVEVLPLNCSDSMLTEKPPVQSRHAIFIFTIIAFIFISRF